MFFTPVKAFVGAKEVLEAKVTFSDADGDVVAVIVRFINPAAPRRQRRRFR